MKMNELFFYSSFNEIDNSILRAWNRFNVMLNMMERFGKQSDIEREYFHQFTIDDQITIAEMALDVADYGYEETRRYYTRGEFANA